MSDDIGKPLGILESNGAARGVHTLLVNKYYLDNLYTDLITRTAIRDKLAPAMYWVNDHIIDRFVFLAGAPSHIDLYDPKPVLADRHGQALPKELTEKIRFAFIQKDSVDFRTFYRRCLLAGTERSLGTGIGGL